MHINKILTIGAVALSMAFGSHSANASYDYTGAFVDMETVSVGDTGVIGNIGHFGSAIVSQVSGSLPSNSMITFTYDFSGDVGFGVLGAFGGYDFDTGSDSYSGYSHASTLFGNSAAGFQNGSLSTPLAVASAQIDFGNNTATAVIKNVSSGVVDYLNLFVGLVSGNKNLEISYSVSAVPLPAALPLFLLGLAGLMGFSYRGKRNAVAAAA
ncbi:MAG: hypothetical protein ACRBDI_06740 [Alphaproteobacteria bacterium]